MKANDLLDLIGNADDSIIAEAKDTRSKLHAPWWKWAALAAGLCLIAVSAAIISKYMKKDTVIELADRFSDIGISAERIASPEFVAQMEMPMITSDSLQEAIRNNLTVQGTLFSLDTVKIVDGDSVWFVTTADIKVDEVICGEYDFDTIHIAGAACYTGMPLEVNAVPVTQMIGCEENTNGVFVLRNLEDGVWAINGKEVSTKSLGDYYIVCYLERSGDTLTFAPQNLSISLEDTVN